MIVRLCDDNGSQLYGGDGRSLEFVGGNAFRSACHAVRGHRRAGVTNGASPVDDIYVVAGDQRWKVETDGSVIPCD